MIQITFSPLLAEGLNFSAASAFSASSSSLIAANLSAASDMCRSDVQSEIGVNYAQGLHKECIPILASNLSLLSMDLRTASGSGMITTDERLVTVTVRPNAQSQRFFRP